jgi:serine/threonine-protein kinase
MITGGAQMAAGYVLGGKYQLLRILGRGSMGEVWSARHATLDEQVAVKIMTRDPTLGGDLHEDVRAAARFRFEAQVAARLSRKTRHIVRVTDHGDENGGAYLVMELLEGKTLAQRLLFRGTLTPPEVGRLLTQTARALSIAHTEGIVHRDLKPANVFLTQDEDGCVLVKLLDFGIARTIHTHRIALPFATGAGFAAGTPGYMSPQQARGMSPDVGFDLWALATIAYEALTGELPVPGSSSQERFENSCAGRLASLQAHEATLGWALTAFFARAFAPRAEHRYASASELAAAFGRAIGDRTDGPRAPSHDPSPLPSKAATLPMRARALSPASPSAGTQRTSTLAMVAPVARQGRAIGSGVMIASTLLLGVASAVLVQGQHDPSSPVAIGASPAANASARGAALVWEPTTAEQPPVVVLSPPAIPPPNPTVRAAAKAPPVRPHLRAATIASSAVAPATIPSATPAARDKSATL